MPVGLLDGLGVHATRAGEHVLIGRAFQRASMPAEARDHWERALAILEEHEVEDDIDAQRSEIVELLATVATEL